MTDTAGKAKSMLSAALDYRLYGYPVFPANPLNKRPLVGKGGLHLATTDEDQIRQWWSEWPNAMIGLPTGEVSGLFVVDLDVDKQTGEAIGEMTADKLGITEALDSGIRATTHSGGTHYYFRDPGPETGRNTAGKIGPGIDTRGNGGYVIAPGSVTAEGGAYRWDMLGIIEVGHDGIPELPDAIADMLRPVSQDQLEPQKSIFDQINTGARSSAHEGVTPDQAWALAALDQEVAAVKSAPAGTRNHQLNSAAFSLGQIVAGGLLREEDVIGWLRHAATECGLWHEDGAAQCEATIQSGLTAGKREPRRPDPKEQYADAASIEMRSHVIDVTRSVTQDTTESANAAENRASNPGNVTNPFDDVTNPYTEPVTAIDKSLEWFDDIEPALADGYIIKNVLGDNAMSVVYGASNSGKTFFALDLAYHVATNATWRTHRVRGGGVLYLAAEGGRGMMNRIAALKQAHHARDVPLAVKRAGLDLLHSTADLQQVADLAAEVGNRASLRLIVVDTLSRVMAGGDENSAQDMTALIRNLDAIRHVTGAHVMLIHHSGKDAARGARGHSSLRAATDTEIEVEDDNGDRGAFVRKQRDYAGGECWPFHLKAVDLGHDDDGDPVGSCIIEVVDDEQFRQNHDRIRGLGGNQKIIADAFDMLVGDGDAYPNPGGQGMPEPGAFWCVDYTRLRSFALDQIISEHPDKAFYQAFRALCADRQLFQRREETVWRVDRPKKKGFSNA